MPLEADDILVKKLSRPDQMVELMIYCFALFVLLLIVGRRIILSKPLLPRLLIQKYSTHLFMFYLIALMSSALSSYPSYSFFRAGQYIIALFLIGYILEDLPNKNVLIKAVYLFCVINLCYLALAYLYFPQLVVGAEGRLTGGGIFRVDNGGIPFITCIFSICYFLTVSQRFWKTFHFSFFIISIVLMFLSQTRNILYPAPFLLLFIILYYKKISFRLFSLVFLAMLIFVLLDYAEIPIAELFTRKKGFTSESRVETWRVVIEHISEVPFFGFGFLGTPSFLMPIKKTLVGARVLITADPHNFFLTAFTELGVLGFLYSIAFLLILLSLLLNIWKTRKSLSDVMFLPGLIAVVLQGIISAFVTNFLLSPISFNTIAIITSIFLLSNAYLRVNNISPKPK